MRKHIVDIARKHFGNPTPFWVDESDNGDFPPAPTPEAMDKAVAFHVIDGKIVSVTIREWHNERPRTSAQYVAYCG